MEKFCDICPRHCHVNRDEKVGFCGATNKVKIAKVMFHGFEEPIISGPENFCDNQKNSEDFEIGEAFNQQSQTGSGAIFFSHCSLKCVYCQNWEISNGGIGKEISTEKLAEIFKKLESAGALNINLVTPTHFATQIVEALKIYKPKIPVVWNTSGFETVETIKMLDGFVDIFLVDFKYFNPQLALELSAAQNYPEVCKKAILQMRKNQPIDIITDGLMKKGMIVRHLILPGQINDSINIIHWIFDNLGNDTIVSLMAQYVPFGKAKLMDSLNRKIKPLEYKIVKNELVKLQFKNAFVQELESASCGFTPNFAQNENKIIF